MRSSRISTCQIRNLGIEGCLRMITTQASLYIYIFIIYNIYIYVTVLSGNFPSKRRGKVRKRSTSATKRTFATRAVALKKTVTAHGAMQSFRLEHGAGWRSVVSGVFLRHLLIACWCNRCQSSWRYLQKHQVWGSGSYTLHLLVSFRYLDLETLLLFSQHVLIVSTRWNFTMVLSFAPDSSCRLLSYSSIMFYICIFFRYIYILYHING